MAPKLVKGMLIAYGTGTGAVLPFMAMRFQFNPDTLQRKLARQEQRRHEGETVPASLCVGGPPSESVTIRIHIDASDELSTSSRLSVVRMTGILPALSFMESLLYPSWDKWKESWTESGDAKATAFAVPTVVLTWGLTRAIPVKLTEISIDETFHDTKLNPIKADVTLSFNVLTGSEFTDPEGFGATLARVNYQGKQAMAAVHAAREAMGLASAGLGSAARGLSSLRGKLS